MNNEILSYDNACRMNYYEILGVPADASEDLIKEKFRKLSKKYHPDLSSNTSFDYRIILDAYKVLIDKNKRMEYDKKLSGETGPSVEKKPAPENCVLSQDRIEYCLSLDNILKNYVMLTRSFKHRDYLDMIGQDIIVHACAAEIRQGCIVRLEIPSRAVCPDCRGSRWECARCRGQGYIRIAERINIRLPVTLKDGEIIEISPQDYMPGNSLARIKRLRLKVEFFPAE